MNRYGYDNTARRDSRTAATPYVHPHVDPNPHYDEEVLRRLQRKRHLEEKKKIRTAFRVKTHERLRTVVVYGALMVGLTLLVAFVLSRAAHITEKSFFNARLNNEISQLEEENDALANRIAEFASPEQAGAVALREFGLQKASSDQIIHVGDAGGNRRIAVDDRDDLNGQVGTVMSRDAQFDVIESYVLGQRYSESDMADRARMDSPAGNNYE